MPVEQSGLVLANPNLDLRAYAALFDATPKETTNQSFLDRGLAGVGNIFGRLSYEVVRELANQADLTTGLKGQKDQAAQTHNGWLKLEDMFGIPDQSNELVMSTWTLLEYHRWRIETSLSQLEKLLAAALNQWLASIRETLIMETVKKQLAEAELTASEAQLQELNLAQTNYDANLAAPDDRELATGRKAKVKAQIAELKGKVEALKQTLVELQANIEGLGNLTMATMSTIAAT